jgi:hypothetical protein
VCKDRCDTLILVYYTDPIPNGHRYKIYKDSAGSIYETLPCLNMDLLSYFIYFCVKVWMYWWVFSKFYENPRNLKSPNNYIQAYTHKWIWLKLNYKLRAGRVLNTACSMFINFLYLVHCIKLRLPHLTSSHFMKSTAHPNPSQKIHQHLKLYKKICKKYSKRER